jgi:hypothetical protein
MTPDEIRDRGLYPAGFMPLPHENHPEGGMVFPRSRSARSRNRPAGTWLASTSISTCQTGLREFPAPIYLTTRPDLGDVSQGKLITTDNYYGLFNGILNPKQQQTATESNSRPHPGPLSKPQPPADPPCPWFLVF